MLRIKKLDERVTAAYQIAPEDVPAIAAAGYRCIMCNRPDGEDDGQPDFDEIEEVAEQYGLEARYVPMGSRDLNLRALENFQRAMDEVDGPILAYCRTGSRCEILWRATREVAAIAAS